MAEGDGLTLDALVEGLKEHDPKKVLESLPRGAGSVYQLAYDKGHQDAVGKERSIRERVEKEHNALRSERDSLQERLQEVESEVPNVEKINEQWEERIGEVRSEKEQEVAALKERLDAAEYGNAIKTLEAKMLKKGLKPLYARVKAKDLRERIRFDEEGKIRVFQKDREIPLEAAPNQSPLDALADEAFNEAEADEKMTGVKSGPGLRDSEGGRGGGQEGDRYQKARERGEEAQKNRHRSTDWREAVGAAE